MRVTTSCAKMQPSYVLLCVALLAIGAAGVPNDEVCDPDLGDQLNHEALLQTKASDKSQALAPSLIKSASPGEGEDDSDPPPASPGEGEGDSDPEKPDTWPDSLLEVQGQEQFLSATRASPEALTEFLQEDKMTTTPRANDFKPHLWEDDKVKTAKERAIEGICVLHTDAARLKGVFQTRDKNKDGKLSSSKEIPAEGGGENEHEMLIDMKQWLNMTLPEPSTFCSGNLPDNLCDGVKRWRQRISEGGTPDAFLPLCSNEAVLEPRADAKTKEPKPIAITEPAEDESPDANASGLLALGSARARLSKREKKAGNQIAWASIMKGVNKLMIADYCYRDVWARGAAERVCKSGWYRGSSGLDSGLCYQNCPSGYYRFGDHCWRHCPSNMNDIGLYCQREYWGSCCTNTWFGRACISCLKIETRDKNPQHKPGCSILSGHCTTCPHDHYSNGALCYKNAKANYHCNGAELTCHRNCVAPLAENCAAACSLDGPSCASNVIETVVGITEAVVQTAALVASFGASAAATAMAASTKAAMKSAAKKSARRVAVRVSKATFKAELKKARKNIIRKAIKDTMKGKIEEKSHELLIKYATDNSDSLMDAYIEKAKKNGDDPALVVIKDVDPSGLATAIDSSVKGDDSANVQAANWLTVFSTVDPTGILGAVAGVIKHSHCESVLAKMQAIEDAEIDVPALKKTCADDILVEGTDAFLRGSWTIVSATQGGRPIYKKGSYYMYYWSAFGEWRLGPNYNSASAWVASGNAQALCPNKNTVWWVWRGSWKTESVNIMEE